MTDKDLEKLQDLAHKWLNGTLTSVEQREFDTWFKQVSDDPIEVPTELADNELTLERALFQKIQARIKVKKQPEVRSLWFRITAAASILIIFSIGVYLLVHNPKPVDQIVQNQTDIAPGSNIAMLKLPGGKRILVGSAKVGTLAQQGSTAINKVAGDLLVYNNGAAGRGDSMVYDTLTVPRKGQYQLKLSDGTRVWLNAATAIRYPENFIGKERRVELLYGEAYFEVVHNRAKPIRVVSNNQVIEDIGTRFNVNAYQDEPLHKTTLLEGSIKVTLNKHSAILRPGEQVQMRAVNPKITLIKDVNTDEVVAWKNGLFIFNDESLESIMRKLSRWYDVDISYQNIDPHKCFWGGISRYGNISQVLQKLELTGGVHFTIEGRRIIAKQ